MSLSNEEAVAERYTSVLVYFCALNTWEYSEQMKVYMPRVRGYPPLRQSSVYFYPLIVSVDIAFALTLLGPLL